MAAAVATVAAAPASAAAAVPRVPAAQELATLNAPHQARSRASTRSARVEFPRFDGQGWAFRS
jgi:hypothetical protein